VATDSSGNATFAGVSLNKVGTAYALKVTSTGAPVQSTTGNAFNIVAGAPASLTLTSQPAASSNFTAGADIPIVAHLQDANANAISGDNITLSIATNPGTSTLSVTTNPVATDSSGDAAFAGVSLNKIGTGYALKVTSTGAPTQMTTSNSFNIIAGAPASLTFTTQPAASSSIAAGANIPLVAHLQDVNANPIAGDDITLSITGNPGMSTLSVTTNPVATSASGDATFAGVSLDKIGSGYTLKAMSTGAPPRMATSNAFDIVAGEPASIAFATEPSDAAAGVDISPAVVVELQDAFANPVADATVTLVIANNAGGSGILSGGGAVQTDSDGHATYSASIDKAGTGYTLSASFDALDATSTAFDIVAGVATQLQFVTQPADLPAGTTTSASVSVTDAFGNVETDDDTTQISISVNACGSTPLGTATVTGGTVVFSALKFYTVTDPAQLQLHASSNTALSGDSDGFVVQANSDGLFWNGFEACVP
jgi:ribosome maturation factor RimP